MLQGTVVQVSDVAHGPLVYVYRHTLVLSCRTVAPGLKKIRMDDLGATVPPIIKNCNLRRTKNCTSFGLINLIFTQIL